MKWVVFIVMMTSQGEMDKLYNDVTVWDELSVCTKFVTGYTNTIVENMAASGLFDNNNTLLGSGGSRNTNSAETGITMDQASNNIQNTGGSQPHNNMQPYLVFNYIIKVR